MAATSITSTPLFSQPLKPPIRDFPYGFCRFPRTVLRTAVAAWRQPSGTAGKTSRVTDAAAKVPDRPLLLVPAVKPTGDAGQDDHDGTDEDDADDA